jgi:hypothetical protein
VNANEDVFNFHLITIHTYFSTCDATLRTDRPGHTKEMIGAGKQLGARRERKSNEFFPRTSSNVRALPRVLKFYFSIHVYNSQLTMKIENKLGIS